ncbi:GNAT family N-acetyltransferase [Zavarzinia sp.]|uniref:GNAT family N-acetyltransferase n=1 Tax=Zavarzinia sp. TaxID=2027920 RepID=UPI003563D67F
MPTTGAERPAVVLRPLVPADAGTIGRDLDDFEIARWTARIPHPYPPGAAEAYLAEAAASDEVGSSLHRAITLAGDDTLLGIISLFGMTGDGSAEVGYWLARRHWGRGIAGEALRALVALARARGLTRLTAQVMTDNARSIGVLTGAGFVKDAGWSAPRENVVGVRTCGAGYVLDLG